MRTKRNMIIEKVEELRKFFNEMTVRIIRLINCYQNLWSGTMKSQDNYGCRPFFFDNFIKYAGSQTGIKRKMKDLKRLFFFQLNFFDLKIA